MQEFCRLCPCPSSTIASSKRWRRPTTCTTEYPAVKGTVVTGIFSSLVSVWRNFQGKGLIRIGNIGHLLIKGFCGEGCQKVALSHRILFRKNFRGIYSERFPFFPGSKCSFRGIPRFTEVSITKLGREWNYMKKLELQKILLQQTELRACFRARTFGSGIPRVCFYFCSTERNSNLFSFPRNVS